MKIVLDTNVLISGMIRAEGPPGRIIDLLRNGRIERVADDRILAEYADVLRRPRFGKYFSPPARESVLEFLQEESDVVASAVICQGLPDPGDAPFLETALTENAILVTGNLKHFPARKRHGCSVLTPSQFLVYFAEENVI